MLLTYVDESYTKDAYYIAALVCPDGAAIPLSRALDAVVEKAAAVHGIDPEAELHGHDLFQAKGAWASLEKLPRVRIGVYNDAFKAIADHDVKIILRGLDQRRLKTRYGPDHDHPHSIVLTHVLERVDECALRHDDLALIIADEVDGQDQYRREFSHYCKVGTWGYKGRQLTRIVDTMHFAPSSSSRLVQAADLIAFLHRRIESHGDVDERATRANARLWSRIEPKISHKWFWVP